MARSRRRYKKSRPKVRVGLPRKKPDVFKSTFIIPEELLLLVAASSSSDATIKEEKRYGMIRAATSETIAPSALSQTLTSSAFAPAPRRLFKASISSFLTTLCRPFWSSIRSIAKAISKSEDFKTALGKKRRDGKSAPLQPLTTMQRFQIGSLIRMTTMQGFRLAVLFSFVVVEEFRILRRSRII